MHRSNTPITDNCKPYLLTDPYLVEGKADYLFGQSQSIDAAKGHLGESA